MMVTQGIYRHYKGGLYRLLFVAEDSGNDSPTQDEPIAVYVSLNEGGRVSVRPLKEFDALITSASDPPRMVPRFEFVSE